MKQQSTNRKYPRWAHPKRTKILRKGGSRARFITHNFSDIEDRNAAFTIIRSIGAKAGLNAAKEAKAAGLSRTYVRNYKDLIRISANGDVIEIAPRLKQPLLYIEFKPSTVFHAVRK